MNASERYIREVLRRVLSAETDRRRLEEDLRAHFDDGATRGESPAQIIVRLGSPEDVAEAFHLERELDFAGFWRRTVAFVGDLGAMLLLLLPFVAVTLWVIAPYESPERAPIGAFVGIVLMLVAIAGVTIFYFPLLEARFGRTLGKHLLAIRVVRETGTPISLGQAFLRRLSLYFELLVPDALFIPFTEGKRRALDILAKTLVVREPERRAAWWGWAICLALPLAAVGCYALLAVFCVR